MKLSLVVPCYNEAENVEAFLAACRKAFDGVLPSYELIFINDGSRDDTWERLKQLRRQAPGQIQLINFSRNFGKEAAMYAGLQRAGGEYVTVIDADLQQPPAAALEMVRFLEANPDYDGVAAYQDNRREGKFTAWCKKIFYRLINAACEIPFRADASDFRTFRRDMVKAILSMGEYHRFSKGIFSWVGFNTYYMPYTVQPRHAGQTSWSFRKLCRYAIEGIVSFSTFPLHIATVTGAIMSVLSLIYILVVVIQKLAFGIAVPGYATIVVLILLIGGLQMIMLGIIGQYIARIYIQTKQRPLYIARDYLPADGPADSGGSEQPDAPDRSESPDKPEEKPEFPA